MTTSAARGPAPRPYAQDRVRAALAELTDLAPTDVAPRVEALLARTARLRLRLLFVGDAKREKSTLVNRLVGRDVLPTGVLPVTSVATSIVGVTEGADRVIVRFRTGATRTVTLDQLPSYIVKELNPGNRRGIEEVRVLLRDARLSSWGVELVDTLVSGRSTLRTT